MKECPSRKQVLTRVDATPHKLLMLLLLFKMNRLPSYVRHSIHIKLN